MSISGSGAAGPLAHPYDSMATAELPFDLIEAKLALACPARRDGGEAGGDRPAPRIGARVVTVVGARRLRQDHAARPSGGAGWTFVCDGGPRRARQRSRGPAALRRGGAGPGHARAAIGVRGALEARSVGLVDLHPTSLRRAFHSDGPCRSSCSTTSISSAIPTSLDAVAALLATFQRDRRSCVSSREEPPLPLARLRAQGRATRDRRGRAPSERGGGGGAAAKRKRRSRRLGRPELTERTEGWPAGLYLAALSLRAGGSEATGPGRSAATTASWPTTCGSSSSRG